MPGKCIVLLLDGTWNDSEAGSRDTNIVRLRELIVSSLDPTDATRSKDDPFARERTFKGRPVALYYDRGVGTGGFFDKYFGGAFGAGLELGIRRAYQFLSNTYDPGDDIFIFGFSRGAYTARSLVGFISIAGLLRKRENNAVNELRAWYFYRTNPKDRLLTLATQLRKLGHAQAAPLINCLGVFDTVGARGIPVGWLWRENRDLFEFHDVELSTISRTNLHALAIDEHREPFQATIWRASKFVDIPSITEQVWFAGAHADVGGGNINYYDRVIDLPDEANAPRKCLDDISLDWMIRRLKKHHPDFPVPDPELRLQGRMIDRSWAWHGEQHEARKGIYRTFPFRLEGDRKLCAGFQAIAESALRFARPACRADRGNGACVRAGALVQTVGGRCSGKKLPAAEPAAGAWAD